MSSEAGGMRLTEDPEDLCCVSPRGHGSQLDLELRALARAGELAKRG